MSTHSFREPTNDELWAQPPVAAAGPAALAPVPQQAVPQPIVAHQAVPQPVVPVAVPPPVPLAQDRQDRTVFVLAIVSMGIGVPLTAIASQTAGRLGLAIVWVGIVLVNAIYAWSRRTR